MPYDERLDARVSALVNEWGLTRRKMFGGTCYMRSGNMLCGVYRDSLILRLGEEGATAALDRPHTSPFDITGKPMTGWVMVEKSGLDEQALRTWLLCAQRFVDTLPPKPGKPHRGKRKPTKGGSGS